MGFYSEEDDYREKNLNNFILNREIKNLRINAEKDSIEFNFKDKSKLYLNAEGECCSKSWFEHVQGVEALIDHAVLRIETRPMPEDSWNGEQDILTRYYGWLLHTDRGQCSFEMRNQSNGYYGGSVEFSDKSREHCDWGQEVETIWSNLEEDF